MLVMRSLIAYDKKTVSIDTVTNNLDQIPSWLNGNTLDLSKWNVKIFSNTDLVTLTNLTYPIEVHHVFASTVIISDIRLYRDLGGNEIYLQIIPTPSPCTLFDMKIEFLEKTE